MHVLKLWYILDSMFARSYDRAGSRMTPRVAAGALCLTEVKDCAILVLVQINRERRKKLRIFIADGNKNQHALYEEWLEGRGHEIVSASSLVEARTMIATLSHVDIAVVDCCFSADRHYENEGNVLIAALRHCFPDVKVLWVGIVEVDGALHLPKPFHEKQFLSALGI